MDQNERFSLVLRARLERCEMTQKQLGQLVGLSQHTISDYVCGKTAPIIGDAASIAKVLSLPLDSIFSLHGREGVYYPSAQEWKLLQLFHQVPDEKKKAVLEMIRCAVKIADEKS